jgi:hypothetical protein
MKEFINQNKSMILAIQAADKQSPLIELQKTTNMFDHRKTL